MSDVSPEAQKLLDATRTAGGPSLAQRAAMKQAVLSTVAAPVPVAAVAKTALFTKVGAAVFVVAVGAVVVLKLAAPAPVEVVEVRRPVVVAEKAVKVAEKAEERAEEKAVEKPEEKPEMKPRPEPRPVHPESSRGVKPPEPAPAPNPVAAAPALPDEATLAREVAAVSRAMGAVDAKGYADALDQLTAYHHDFPAGVLSSEARVVEVLALCGLGRVDDARAAAASVPKNNPAARRLERSCAR